MRKINIAKLTFIFFLSCLRVWSEPTEVRSWKSTAGTSIEAAALKVENLKVFLKAADGREFTVPLEKFAGDDQAFLKKHFEIKAPEPGQPTASTVPLVEGGLAHPAGQVSGPIDAGGGSHYFVYVPKTIRKDRKASLMFFTVAGGGSQGIPKIYAKSAELAGWIIAVSVESKNGNDFDLNHTHSKRCVEHLLANLPIDEMRVYFTGNSGGGAMSFYNALRIESAGNMPMIAYSSEKKYDKKQYCYGVGGTKDFNRYLTAHAVAQYKENGFHRLHVGGHSEGPDWIGDEGIMWLTGRYLSDRRKENEFDNERLDYEASLIGWIRDLSEEEPFRAHYWCDFLTNQYEITGPNELVVTDLLTELNKDPINAKYTEGLAAINDFSKKFYAPEGEGSGSAFGETTPKINSASEALATKYKGVPMIEEIARDLGSPTVEK